MRLLVTGGTGFIGSAFVRAALARGHRVAALTRGATASPPPSEGTAGAGTAALPVDPDLLVIPGSLAEPPRALIASFAPEVCLHSAWIATPGVYATSPVNDELLGWSRAFLDLLVELGVPRIVGVGTCVEYGPSDRPVSETSALAPDSPYARCKDQLRRHLAELGERKGASWAWCRLFYPYGAGEHPGRFPSLLARRIATESRIELRTGSSVKDYIHVDDVARALLAVVESQAQGCFNVGTGTGVSIKDLAALIVRLAAPAHRVDLVDLGEPDPHRLLVADPARLAGIGWRPTVPLEAGVAGLIQSLRSAAR